MNANDAQRDDWKQFLEYHPELRDSIVGVDDFDDVEPSCGEVLRGEVKSPSAIEGAEFRFGSIRMVGHGKQTNHWCGSFGKFLACSRVELHNKMIFDKDGRLVDCRGKADVHPVFRSCDKPSCPVCYERGWAVREADNITFRLQESAKRLDHVAFGDVEHIIASVDPKDWGLSEEQIRKKVLEGLKRRGVVGGCIISHWARFERGVRGWHLGVHYHCLSFIRSGFRKCRGCSHVNDKGSRFFCKGCSNFYGVSKECYKSDGLIVEVKGRRKSVFGTAFYQLNHSTFDSSKRRHNIVKWFGVCSYRRMKVPKEARKEYNEKRKPKCRICGSLLVRHEYCGHDLNILAWFAKRRGAREKVERFFGLACDFVQRPEVRKWGSGSYEED